MKKGIELLVGIFILPLVPLTAQFMENRTVPPPPVVQSLSAQVIGASVTLTWLPAPMVEGNYIILRGTEPITSENRSTALELASIPITEKSWNGTLPDERDYFFAVATQEPNGFEYSFFLPFSNALILPVRADTVPATSEPLRFTSFNAKTREDAVILTWTVSGGGRNLILYRSTTPFRGLDSLLTALVVSTFTDDGTPYVDYPVPGVPYYYAIIDDDTLRTGTARFQHGINTISVPVEVSASYAVQYKGFMPAIRPIPLPLLNPNHEFHHGNVLFSSDTEAIIRALSLERPIQIPKVREPYIFLSDVNSDTRGEEFVLRQVLAETFRQKKWEETITALERFLTIRRSPRTKARTHFYLGQAYNFTGRYHEALKEFLLSQDEYYAQSREWIQYILRRIISKSYTNHEKTM